MIRTPTLLQMEATECGAVCLGIILAHWGRYVPLEELRLACGISRDGSNAKNIVIAAKSYGLIPKAYRVELDRLKTLPYPLIVFWNFNHFLVVEGYHKGFYYLNNPARGHYRVTESEFDESFTGIAITFQPGPNFIKSKSKPSSFPLLLNRLKNSKEALGYVALTGLALVFPGLIIPLFSRIFIDNILVNHLHHWIGPLLIGMAVTSLFRMLLTGLQQHYLLKLETKISIVGAGEYLWHVLRLPIEFYSQRYTGDISSRAAIPKRMSQLLGGQLVQAAMDAFLIIFYAFVLFSIDSKLSLVGFSVILINIILARVIHQRREDSSQRLALEQGKLTGVSMNGLQSIETLKAMGSESDFFSVWAGHHAKLLSAQQELQSATQYVLQLPMLLQSIAYVLVLYWGSLRIVEGDLSLGMLVAFLTLMMSMIQPIYRCMELLNSFQEVESDLFRLNDVLTYPVDLETGALDIHHASIFDTEKLGGRLELKNISFGYSRLEPPWIEHFNLEVLPGMRIAIVGFSGSGKSTLSKLMTGLYSPWSGEVLFDGFSRHQIPRVKLSDSIAFVNQEIVFFNGSIRDNLTLWDSTISDPDLIQACQDACIHSVIASRSEGYENILKENGSNFSGGQRQQLEIARALVRNPTLLVLDEATSSLDPVTEFEIDRNLRKRGCTCIIIAHRLSTVRDADLIIVMDKGKVVQQGPHDELLEESQGLYLKLVQDSEPAVSLPHIHV